jgi:hypothetical protein
MDSGRSDLPVGRFLTVRTALTRISRSNIEYAPCDLACVRMALLPPGMQGYLHRIGGKFAHHPQSNISERDKLPGKEFELGTGLTQRGFRNEGAGFASGNTRTALFR